MVLLLVFMQLTRDLFAIAKFLFRLAENHYGIRGHEKKLTKVRSRLDTRKFFFSQRVANGWNSLPAEVVNAESVNSFKNSYTTALIKIWTTEAD